MTHLGKLITRATFTVLAIVSTFGVAYVAGSNGDRLSWTIVVVFMFDFGLLMADLAIEKLGE